MLPIIIWPRGDVAGGDPDPGDARVVKHDAEEGQAPIAGRGTEMPKISLPSTSKYSIRVLAPRGFPSCLRGPIPSGSSTSVKTAPKPLTVAGSAPAVPGTKNLASVMLLPTGVNRRNGL